LLTLFLIKHWYFYRFVKTAWISNCHIISIKGKIS
jgi:hypothetical protein